MVDILSKKGRIINKQPKYVYSNSSSCRRYGYSSFVYRSNSLGRFSKGKEEEVKKVTFAGSQVLGIFWQIFEPPREVLPGFYSFPRLF